MLLEHVLTFSYILYVVILCLYHCALIQTQNIGVSVLRCDH